MTLYSGRIRLQTPRSFPPVVCVFSSLGIVLRLFQTDISVRGKEVTEIPQEQAVSYCEFPLNQLLCWVVAFTVKPNDWALDVGYLNWMTKCEFYIDFSGTILYIILSIINQVIYLIEASRFLGLGVVFACYTFSQS